MKGLYCADIITFNTVALKGSIRDVGRALGISLDIIDDICKNITDDNIDSYREQYQELFDYVDIINGTVVSIGTHPCGLVCSPMPLDENMGLLTLATCENPVTMLNMKEIDSLNYVKLDVLGLDNIQIINETCALAGIDRLTPQNIDDNDLDVWQSIKEETFTDLQLNVKGCNDIYESFALARDCGFDNINMDLILGLVDEDLEMVRNTLEEIKKLSPESLTVHTLAIKRASKLKEDIQT